MHWKTHCQHWGPNKRQDKGLGTRPLRAWLWNFLSKIGLCFDHGRPPRYFALAFPFCNSAQNCILIFDSKTMIWDDLSCFRRTRKRMEVAVITVQSIHHGTRSAQYAKCNNVLLYMFCILRNVSITFRGTSIAAHRTLQSKAWFKTIVVETFVTSWSMLVLILGAFVVKAVAL